MSITTTAFAAAMARRQAHDHSLLVKLCFARKTGLRALGPSGDRQRDGIKSALCHQGVGKSLFLAAHVEC